MSTNVEQRDAAGAAAFASAPSWLLRRPAFGIGYLAPPPPPPRAQRRIREHRTVTPVYISISILSLAGLCELRRSRDASLGPARPAAPETGRQHTRGDSARATARPHARRKRGPARLGSAESASPELSRRGDGGGGPKVGLRAQSAARSDIGRGSIDGAVDLG